MNKHRLIFSFFLILGASIFGSDIKPVIPDHQIEVSGIIEIKKINNKEIAQLLCTEGIDMLRYNLIKNSLTEKLIEMKDQEFIIKGIIKNIENMTWIEVISFQKSNTGESK